MSRKSLPRAPTYRCRSLRISWQSNRKASRPTSDRFQVGPLDDSYAKGSDMTRFHRWYTAVCRVWHPWACSRAGPRAKRFSGESEPPESAVETIGASGEFGRNAHASPLGCARPPGQNPAKGREILGQLAPRLNEPRRRRLVGGASRIRTRSIALLSPALRWGESRANPNRPTWQQRKTWAAASFRRGTRSLRCGCAKPLAQNPAESRDFPGRLALLPKNLCVGRLGGGAASRSRTRLPERVP